jgi:hypothetical protein
MYIITFLVMPKLHNQQWTSLSRKTHIVFYSTWYNLVIKTCISCQNSIVVKSWSYSLFYCSFYVYIFISLCLGIIECSLVELDIICSYMVVSCENCTMHFYLKSGAVSGTALLTGGKMMVKSTVLLINPYWSECSLCMVHYRYTAFIEVKRHVRDQSPFQICSWKTTYINIKIIMGKSIFW